MKTTLIQSQFRGLRCVKFKAVILPSKKLNIPRRFQKTWRLESVAPEHSADEMQPSLMAEALRWEQKVMKRIEEMKNPKPKVEPEKELF